MSGVFPAPHRAFHRLQRTPQMMTDNHAAVNLGYDSIEDLCEKVDVGSVVQSEPNQEA
ncbi:hypothetical protein SEA_MINNIE_83 [Mycobacterium phage Minnie]|uniref:Uncharacterized protein n=1 Tax=Mycobacterium phage Minnie TaxID=2653764 RepID=A0A5Q2WPS7_9CAUD|nr:hypothetical protein I5H65_gp083 [Mycobacterium phage Minnie]QGH79651.1 hypothetical protein SEA_MINNIE_83 [Mycobacterium phage Minnie]